VIVTFFPCGYDKRVTTLFCAVIQTFYFVDFNRHSGVTVSIFIVVLVFVDVRKRCFVCACAWVCVRQQRVSEYL
jgi:hypothetical protein